MKNKNKRNQEKVYFKKLLVQKIKKKKLKKKTKMMIKKKIAIIIQKKLGEGKVGGGNLLTRFKVLRMVMTRRKAKMKKRKQMLRSLVRLM